MTPHEIAIAVIGACCGGVVDRLIHIAQTSRARRGCEHRYQVTAVNTYKISTASGKPRGHVTDCLLVCSSCGDRRTEEVPGSWTLDELRGKRDGFEAPWQGYGS